MDFELLYGFWAVFTVFSYKMACVSGFRSWRKPACLRVCFPSLHILASPDDLSIFLPLHLTEWYKTSPCLMQMQPGTVTLR